MNKEKA